jgi:hypothetical protein
MLGLSKRPNRIVFFFPFTWGQIRIQSTKRRVFSLLKIRMRDKVQKANFFIQQPSSEPFRIYVEPLLAFGIAVIPSFILLVIHHQEFYSLWACFEKETPVRWKDGSINLLTPLSQFSITEFIKIFDMSPWYLLNATAGILGILSRGLEVLSKLTVQPPTSPTSTSSSWGAVEWKPLYWAEVEKHVSNMFIQGVTLPQHEVGPLTGFLHRPRTLLSQSRQNYALYPLTSQAPCLATAGYVSVCVQALMCWFSLFHYMFRPTWPSSSV